MTCTKICMDAPFNALSPWTTRRAENLKAVQINTCNALHCECVWASVWPCVVFCNLQRRTMSPSQCQFDVQFDDHFTVRPPVRRPKADEQVYVATQLQKRQNHNALAFLPFRGVWKSDSSAANLEVWLHAPVCASPRRGGSVTATYTDGGGAG